MLSGMNSGDEVALVSSRSCGDRVDDPSAFRHTVCQIGLGIIGTTSVPANEDAGAVMPTTAFHGLHAGGPALIGSGFAVQAIVTAAIYQAVHGD